MVLFNLAYFRMCVEHNCLYASQMETRNKAQLIKVNVDTLQVTSANLGAGNHATAIATSDKYIAIGTVSGHTLVLTHDMKYLMRERPAESVFVIPSIIINEEESHLIWVTLSQEIAATPIVKNGITLL